MFSTIQLLQVETLKQCSADGDDDCVPDLRINVRETRIRYLLTCKKLSSNDVFFHSFTMS